MTSVNLVKKNTANDVDCNLLGHRFKIPQRCAYCIVITFYIQYFKDKIHMKKGIKFKYRSIANEIYFWFLFRLRIK